MKILSSLVLAAALSVAAPAFAQQAPLPPHHEGRFDDTDPDNQAERNLPSAEKQEETRKKIEAVRIWRLTEELKLDQDKVVKVSSLLSSLDQKRREILQEQMATMKTLRQALKARKPDEAKIKPLLDKLEQDHHAIQELRDREIKNLQDILTVEQQARFLLFQQKFQREMREMISTVRGNGPGKTGMGQGNGPMRGGPGMPPENR